MIVSRNNKHRKLQQKHPKNKYFIIDNRFCHKKNNERKEKLNACSFSKNQRNRWRAKKPEKTFIMAIKNVISVVLIEVLHEMLHIHSTCPFLYVKQQNYSKKMGGAVIVVAKKLETL